MRACRPGSISFNWSARSESSEALRYNEPTTRSSSPSSPTRIPLRATRTLALCCFESCSGYRLSLNIVTIPPSAEPAGRSETGAELVRRFESLGLVGQVAQGVQYLHRAADGIAQLGRQFGNQSASAGKVTAGKISNEKKRLAPDYVNSLKPGSDNKTRKIEDSIDFDSFWTRILEKQINLEAAGYVRKRRGRIVLAIVVFTLIISFFGAAYIGSYRALADGDITYGIAVKRLLSGIPLIFKNESPEPEYLERTGYQTKEQLLNKHPGAFILLPPFIPEGYSATEFAYMTHTDGYTTAIDYNVTEFAFFTIEYAVRDEFDPFSYRIIYYEYEIVNEGNVSFYLFKERNYGFTAAFFLDDIYVTIKGRKNYRGTDKASITSMVSGIMSEYYGTVTD